MATRRILKQDPFGTVLLESAGAATVVTRDTGAARWWLRGLARAMARREAAALERMGALCRVPRLIAFDGVRLTRSYLAGEVMFQARPDSREYFRAALKLVVRMHRCNVAHNDLAKEANWLRLADGGPGIIDFQVASVAPHRSKLFRVLAREDLRHLYKHKQHYLPNDVTARQRRLLSTPSVAARCWRALVKPPYRWITRALLGWPERSGPEERQGR